MGSSKLFFRLVLSYALFFNIANADGNEKYTPTKLEWLVLELNSMVRSEASKSGYVCDFNPFPPNTIVMNCIIGKEQSVDVVEELIKSDEDLAKVIINGHGWNWPILKVEKKLTQNKKKK